MHKTRAYIIGAFIVIIAIGSAGILLTKNIKKTPIQQQEDQGGLVEALHPLSIAYMRQQTYPGSEMTIEQTLSSGSHYKQFIASYKSDGLKIYALLTVPQGVKPEKGWPVIIFNHGFIPPQEYRTTERYGAYVDAFARRGYIVFKSDYRGHGNSEGKAEGGYGSTAYTIDVLNAVSSLKKYQYANPDRIGMWGHSMGGAITLRSMVVSKDIKVGVIWAGVVASYPDLLNHWRRRNRAPTPQWTTSWRQRLIDQYGAPEVNPSFWDSISATSYVGDISGPIQLHHARDDSHVPFLFSEKLDKVLQDAQKSVEFYSYSGNDHNLANSFNSAMSRSVTFFDSYLKD